MMVRVWGLFEMTPERALLVKQWRSVGTLRHVAACAMREWSPELPNDDKGSVVLGADLCEAAGVELGENPEQWPVPDLGVEWPMPDLMDRDWPMSEIDDLTSGTSATPDDVPGESVPDPGPGPATQEPVEQGGDMPVIPEPHCGYAS